MQSIPKILDKFAKFLRFNSDRTKARHLAVDSKKVLGANLIQLAKREIGTRNSRATSGGKWEKGEKRFNDTVHLRDRNQCIVPTDCTHIALSSNVVVVHKQARGLELCVRPWPRHTDGGRVCVAASGTGGRSITEYRVPDAASPVSARAIFHRKFLRAPIAGVLHRFGAVLSRPTRRFVSFDDIYRSLMFLFSLSLSALPIFTVQTARFLANSLTEKIIILTLR